MRILVLIPIVSICLSAAAPALRGGENEPGGPQTTIAFQRSLGKRGNLVILRDLRKEDPPRPTYRATYVAVIVDTLDSETVIERGMEAGNKDDVVLDAYVPDGGQAILVAYAPRSQEYLVSLGDTRDIGSFPVLLGFPPTSPEAKSILHAKISEEDANRNTVVTLWNDRDTWKFRFNDGHRWDLIEGRLPATQPTEEHTTGQP